MITLQSAPPNNFHPIFPISYKEVLKRTVSLMIETVKLVAIAVFLTILSQVLLIKNRRYMKAEVQLAIVFGPLLEEIVFRFLLMKLIRLVQNNSLSKKGPQNFLKKYSKIFRVHFAASIFAAAHLSNEMPNAVARLKHLSWVYTGGVVYGNLFEKYNSLAPSYLAHGLNNFFAISLSGFFSPKAQPYLLGALFLNKVVFCILGLKFK